MRDKKNKTNNLPWCMCVWSSFEKHGAGAALKLCVYEQVRAFVFINTSFLKQKNNTHFILCFLISAPPDSPRCLSALPASRANRLSHTLISPRVCTSPDIKHLSGGSHVLRAGATNYRPSLLRNLIGIFLCTRNISLTQNTLFEVNLKTHFMRALGAEWVFETFRMFQT